MVVRSLIRGPRDPFRTVLGIAVLACAGFQAASCGGDALPDGEAFGVVHVRNAPEGEWGEEGGWDFEEIWRFDTWAGSQPEHFGGAPLSVSIAPNGHVWVGDLDRGEVAMFDADGRFVQRVAREGLGPGEVNNPSAIAWDASGNGWVTEGGFRSRYLVFDVEGNLLEEHPRSPGTTPGRLQPGVIDRDGRLLAVRSLGRVGGRSQEVLLLVQAAPDGPSIDTLPPLLGPEGDFPDDRGGGPVGALEGSLYEVLDPFRPRLVTAVTPDAVWFARSDRYRLTHRSHAGDTLMVVEARHRTPSLARDDARMIERTIRQSGRDPSDFDAFGRQIIQSIHVLDDGHLLVQIEEEAGQDGRLFDVFGPHGSFLGSLRAPFAVDPSSHMASKGDTLVAVARDELGVRSLVKITIRR